MNTFRTLVHISLVFVGALAASAEDKLAATPPMGWNSWNHFADKVD